MKLLLDTHAFIWMAADPERLSDTAAAVIADAANDVFVSAVSGWEIAIKRARGRLQFPDVDRAMLDQLRCIELPVALRHTHKMTGLPDHHRDPFDRMLIAQAQTDGLTVVSRDRAFEEYDVAVAW